MDLTLSLLLADKGLLVLGHLASELPRLLRSQVERHVLLLLVEQAELLALCDIDDCEDAGDGLAEVVAEVRSQSSDTVESMRYSQFQNMARTPDLIIAAWNGDPYIFVSFDCAPPAIFCVRS